MCCTRWRTRGSGSRDEDMKKIVILATVHQYQVVGHHRNPELEERLEYLKSRLAADVVMEEWSDKLGQSAAKAFAAKLGLHWANIGPPEEEKFRTYTGPINFPGHDGTLQPPDWHAPGIYEYGPFEKQEDREKKMAENIQAVMEGHKTGLLVCGLAHLHSLFGKLIASGFEVLGFSFI
jgi:hypothetical protein